MNEDFYRDRILATAAHEAMPGHFMQLSIARRHPDCVRKSSPRPFRRGWAFYGEEMLVRLGLYGDGLDARLSPRAGNGCGAPAHRRASSPAASGACPGGRFFEEHSGFTRSAAEAAVNGFALYPGYVIAYTVGRLQLEVLLAEYMHRIGDAGRFATSTTACCRTARRPSRGRARAAGRPRQAGRRGARGGELLIARRRQNKRNIGAPAAKRGCDAAFADSRRCGAALGAAFTAVARAAWVELYGRDRPHHARRRERGRRRPDDAPARSHLAARRFPTDRPRRRHNHGVSPS